MQVNKTLTSLNLGWNKLGPQGGKAIAQLLEVTFRVPCHTLSLLEIIFFCFLLSHDSEYICVFFSSLLFFHAGKQDADQSEFVEKYAWATGRKRYRPIARGEIQISPTSMSRSLSL
jgi:hypothetical protein